MSSNQKILIVDDDSNIAELLELYLNKEFFDTKISGDGIEAVRTFEEYKPDLILLDLMLPGIDGYEVCKRIRMTSNVPIIMMSAKGETFDKVLGLELGADDYVMKPFESKEMVARVKAVLRRYNPQSVPAVAASVQKPAEEKGEYVSYKDLIINLTTYTVVYRGEILSLPPKEFELLYYLASHPNQVFTRDQILESVWGYDYIGDTRTVDVHVKRLREKISDGKDWSLTTVWGRGYKFEVHIKN
ncbi:MAG: response regulator transcription factor [Clostridiales bacterium]|nr:response regulator transcription factor [Clostridiales bacterium]